MKRQEKQNKKEVFKESQKERVCEEEKAKERSTPLKELAGKEESPEQGKLPEKENLAKEEEEKLPKEVNLSYQEYKSIKEKADLADQYFDRLLRIQAESDNLKKRLIKEQIEFVKYANEQLIAQLIGIIDDFERAMESAKRTEDFKTLSQGVGMIAKDLQELLEKKGLVKINEIGVKFDPVRHEAIEQVITDQHPEETVIEVLRKGYALNDRIIRPATVKVSKKLEHKNNSIKD